MSNTTGPFFGNRNKTDLLTGHEIIPEADEQLK